MNAAFSANSGHSYFRRGATGRPTANRPRGFRYPTRQGPEPCGQTKRVLTKRPLTSWKHFAGRTRCCLYQGQRGRRRAVSEFRGLKLSVLVEPTALSERSPKLGLLPVRRRSGLMAGLRGRFWLALGETWQAPRGDAHREVSASIASHRVLADYRRVCRTALRADRASDDTDLAILCRMYRS